MGRLTNKVGHKYNKTGQKDILLKYFLNNPDKKHTVRTLALKTNLPKSTVQYYLQQLKKEGVISENNQWINNWRNKLFKQQHFVKKLINSGLIELIETELVPTAIILFGSFAKGEYIHESDIDIFVECARKKKLDLTKYEKILNHSIDLFIEGSINEIPKNLRNNIINGVKIKGYISIWN